MSITKTENHSEEAVARLISQFKGKERIEALVTAFVDQYQDLENMSYDMENNRSVNTAVGNQLDQLGEIVDVARGGLDNEDYRKAIITKIAINVSKGTPENLLAIFLLLTEAQRAIYLETHPAEVEIYANENIEYVIKDDGEDAFAFDGGIDGLGFGDIFDADVGGTFAYIEDNDVQALYITCDKVIPAGVRLNWIGWYDGDDGFTFAGDSEGKGFGDALDSTVGGRFGKLIEPNFLFGFASASMRTRGFGDLDDILVGGNFDTL